ncbi:unnamed protein product [Peniophora sp. CBMAI 1063]|nr:unnamed protein product [Peniophora sp. CBMAI 1063]
MSNPDLESLNGGERGERKGKGASSKSKDLSHVPCKFYRVGACTAGASCPFSHTAPEPGQSKDVCAWFVKGNCKFGHKCALAHILPGQPMSMDRKNKKAAQQANAAAGGKDGSRGGRGKGDRDRRRGDNGLFSGSTAPTRSARAPMPMALKATISPSAPAPPISDSDFAAFGMPDEATKLPSAPATRKSTSEDPPADVAPPETAAADHAASAEVEAPSRDSPKPLPTSTPSQPLRINDSRPATGLAPIGSPRSNSSREHANGFSPGTSPTKGANMLSTSPFSAPGTQTAFNLVDKSDFRLRSGIAASLGTRSWADYRLPSGGQDSAADGVVVEEDDLEEFVPGSLSELLSPEERERRYSRTAATQALNPSLASPRDGAGWTVNGRPSVEAHHHRYSRSVPGVNPIQNMSIWSDSAGFTGTSPNVGSPRATGMAGIAGTPGSFKSGSVTGAGMGGRSFVDDAQINAFLSPTNASAAFLPGTAQHYMSKNNPLPRTLSDGPRQQSALRGAYASTPPGANAANLLARLNEPIQPQTAGPARTQFEHAHTSESLGGAPYLGARGPLDQPDMASPSAQALQMHAPGQSLPQGLAAGYSRIHALPPPPVIPSPSASSALGSFVPGTSFSGHHVSDWMGMSPAKGAGLTLDGQSPYAMRTGPMRPGMGAGAAPIASRTPSGKSWAAPTSPLSRPVLGAGDDDDLFVLDH